jgi:orotidine-5'-phosphate decarboxylase
MNPPLTPKDRLIVALDVPTIEEALAAVASLDNVSFFKVGLQLFLTGGLPGFLAGLGGKQIFVDLKVPGDIGNTIASVVDQCVRVNARFLTLSESMPPLAIEAAVKARRAAGSRYPQFLTVPFLSSMGAEDLSAISQTERDLDSYILTRARRALEAGCDGIIASGDAIRLCRKAFPNTIIVSPGIRPAGTSADDHKRHTTPTKALDDGADFLVVGRPILNAENPHEAAASILDEIDDALDPLTGLPVGFRRS